MKIGKSQNKAHSVENRSSDMWSPEGHIHQWDEPEIQFQVPHRFTIPEQLGIPLSPRVFTSTYFDSELHQLGRLGLTLRRRIERGRGVWQLKMPSGDYRIELEIESGSRHIPFQFVDLLTAYFRKQDPVQLGKLRTWRTGYLIQDKGKILAELTLDSVALLQDHKIVSRFREMELEVKGGTADQVTFIRKSLQKAGAKPKLFQPKIFQALELPYPFVSPELDPTAPPSEHIRTSFHAQINQMIFHDPGTRFGRDSEALHQMRVATRRMRAIIHTLRPFLEPGWTETFKQEGGWIGSLLGKVRDWDVLLAYFRQEFSDLPSLEPRAFQSIVEKFEGQRSVARARLLEGLRSDRYLSLLSFLEHSTSHFPFQQDTPDMIELAHRSIEKVNKFVNSSSGFWTPQNLHRMRILVKRARYTVELAEPFLGKAAKRFLKQAKTLQDLLGRYQDAAVVESRVLALQPRSHGPGMAFLSGVIVERLRNGQNTVIQRAPIHWKKLQKIGEKL